MKKQTKKCPKCRRTKTIDLLYKATGRKDGLQAICKTCVSTYQNLPEVRRYHLEYQRKPKSREYKKRYYQTPRAKFSTCRQAAIKRHHTFNLSFEDFMTFWQKPCYYCGTAIETIGLDQIIPGAGYSLTNIRACGWTCNRMKFDRTEEEFFQHVKKLLNNNKNLGIR